MNEDIASDVLERYSKVAVIGAGVIGASWTAVFLAHGLSVVVNDPRDDVEAVVHDYIRKATPTLKALGLPTQNLTKKLTVHAHGFSVTAREKIEAAGGTAVELGERKKKKPRDRTASTKDKSESAVEAAEEPAVSEQPAGEEAAEGAGDGSGG